MLASIVLVMAVVGGRHTIHSGDEESGQAKFRVVVDTGTATLEISSSACPKRCQYTWLKGVYAGRRLGGCRGWCDRLDPPVVPEASTFCGLRHLQDWRPPT